MKGNKAIVVKARPLCRACQSSNVYVRRRDQRIICRRCGRATPLNGKAK